MARRVIFRSFLLRKREKGNKNIQKCKRTYTKGSCCVSFSLWVGRGAIILLLPDEFSANLFLYGFLLFPTISLY